MTGGGGGGGGGVVEMFSPSSRLIIKELAKGRVAQL